MTLVADIKEELELYNERKGMLPNLKLKWLDKEKLQRKIIFIDSMMSKNSLKLYSKNPSHSMYQLLDMVYIELHTFNEDIIIAALKQ